MIQRQVPLRLPTNIRNTNSMSCVLVRLFMYLLHRRLAIEAGEFKQSDASIGAAAAAASVNASISAKGSRQRRASSRRESSLLQFMPYSAQVQEAALIGRRSVSSNSKCISVSVGQDCVPNSYCCHLGHSSS